jgi:hypothetical protein
MDNLASLLSYGTVLVTMLTVVLTIVAVRGAKQSLRAHKAIIRNRARTDDPEPRKGQTSAADSLKKTLNYLLTLGVKDPDVDLFIGVLEGDLNRVKRAIAQGANVDVTDTQLLRRYESKLQGFARSPQTAK